MWFLLWLAFFSVTPAIILGDNSGDKVFRKCCAKTQSLVKVTVITLGVARDSYECLNEEDFQIIYNITVSSIKVSDSVTIVSGLLECDEIQAVHFNDADMDLYTSTDSLCYDRLALEISNNSIKHGVPKTVSLLCPRNKSQGVEESSARSTLKIDHIRKCCPEGFGYDTELHTCRKIKAESTEEWILKQFKGKDYIYEIEIGLHCKSDQYSIELTEDRFYLNVEGSNLLVLGKTGEVNRNILQEEWCIERDYRTLGLMARVCNHDCLEFGAFCMKKCCPIGEHYRPRRCGSLNSVCVPNTDSDLLFNISTYMDPLTEYYNDINDVMGIKWGIRCPAGKFAMNRSSARDWHRLTRDGLLETTDQLTSDYCIEAFDRRHCMEEDVYLTTILCFVEAQKSKDFRVSFVLNSVSAVCLGLTLLVYCTLSELRNLHGRTLICHTSTMLLAYSCLARVQYGEVKNHRLCTMLGYGIYFGFVAAFAWLNVMCLDIWWTFGSVRTVQPLRKRSTERRRFLWYSLYAWTASVTLTVTMFLLDKYPISIFLDANVGDNICWFGAAQNTDTDWPHYIFFVVPMGLVTCTNFVLWALTARHCARVKAEVHRLQAGSVGDRAKRRFRVDRAKYVLTGKLWIVMGAGWVSELLSTVVVEPAWLWTVFDLCNELQGVLIFIILVFKPKVYYLIRKKLGLEKPDPQKTTASSGRTSSTFLSRTISSDERANTKTSMTNNIKKA